MKRLRTSCMAGLLGLLTWASPTGAIPAFPGAEGFGADSPGGRGGRIVEVTNLNDDGPGSLRDALEMQTGPRIVVFRVGGTIALTRDICIREVNSFVTVAGQTAPGDGIQLKNYGIVVRDGGHDAVIRYLRVRPGDTTPGVWDKDGVLIWGNSGSHVYNVVIDHVSMEWAIDENANVWGWATGITFQWCVFAEGSLTGHPDGAHGKGFLSGNDSRITQTIHHSLFAHNDDRNPKFGDNAARVNDFRNNVVFNWGNNNCSKLADGARSNFVANDYIAGPDTSIVNQRVIFVPDAGNETNIGVYVEENRGPLCPLGCADAWDIGVWYDDGGPQPADPVLYRSSVAFAAPTVTTDSVDTARDEVLAGAGASCPVRDAVDLRIVGEARSGTGAVGVGSGYPLLQSGLSPADTDRDGMPDSWERQRGLDPIDPGDGNCDLDGDGYTNVEEYLNGLCCPAPPARVTGVRAVRRGDDVELHWDAARDDGTLTYNVWAVLDQDPASIPLANQIGAGPYIALVACSPVPRAAPLCLDSSAVPASPALVFYQVRGACAGGREGSSHPL